MARPIRTDATDVSVTVRIIDSAAGTAEEGVTSATSGLALWYRKGTGGAKTAISVSDLSALTDAHSDGGILHVDDGWYRLDVADAAVPDSAGEATVIGGTATDMIVLGCELVGVTDLTAAEVNAEADTALTDYDPPTRAELTSDIAGLNDLSAAQVNAEVDSALADYDAPTKAELDTGLAGLNDPTVAEIWAGITAAAGNFIADHVLRRSWASAAASANGDTKGFRSLLGAVAKLVNRVAISGGTLSVYEADDTTVLGTQTVTTDASAEPVTGANTDG